MQAKHKILLFLCTAAFLYAVTSPYAQQQKTKSIEDMVKDVAADAYLKVGDLDLVLPLVAVNEPSYGYAPFSFPSWGRYDKKAQMKKREEFRELSSKPQAALKLERVGISIQQYQYYGELAASQKICTLLQRDWAKHFCKGEHKEMMNKLPERFYIVDEKNVDLFSSHYTVGHERVLDQIKKLNLEGGNVDAACDADGKFCTAGVRSSSDTLAIWTVWPTKKPEMSAKEMAEVQGKAILAFIKYGVGPKQNFLQMQTEMASMAGKESSSK